MSPGALSPGLFRVPRGNTTPSLSKHQGMPYKLPQECPHCPEHPDFTELDAHIADAHGDLPACTATLDAAYTNGVVQCSFRVGHRSGDFGDWHASKSVAPMGRTVWNDSEQGATPHRGA